MHDGPMHDGPQLDRTLHNGLVDEVLVFIEAGDIWIDGRLDALVAALRSGQSDGHALPSLLADGFGPLIERQAVGPVPIRLRADLEAVVYPRLWKLVEGILGEMTAGELVNRVDALHRGLNTVLHNEFAD